MTEQHLDVAVIDGGIFLEHEDLSDNYRTFIQGISEPRDEPTFAKHRSWNFESDTYEQYDSHFFQRLSDTNRKLYQYYFGHGTAVAHILTTFPLVPDPVKLAARNAFRDIERGLVR